MKKLARWLQNNFDREDFPVVLFTIGLSLLGYGLSQFHRGLGFAAVGLLVVLYVRPLSRMIK